MSQPRPRAQKMAVNRIKGAFAIPKKGETFELRAGLVYVTWHFHMIPS